MSVIAIFVWRWLIIDLVSLVVVIPLAIEYWAGDRGHDEGE